jgi:hypothetical protein
MNEKQPYESPKLEDLGSVVDLTKHGRTNGEGDTFFREGSVYPPPFQQ